MTEDHERIDELLAGYVLLSLSGEEAAEADRILVDHVPSCATCRATLSEFQAVSGDLALAAPPVDPPETLLPRLHHAMDEVPLAGRTPRRGALIAVAASAVALVAMGGLSLVLGSRLSNAETRTGTALEILSAMRSPGASPVNVSPQESDRRRTAGWSRSPRPTSAPSTSPRSSAPSPRPGHGYQLWLGSNGEWTPVGEMFWPEDGVLLLEVTDVDVSQFDEVWITQEAAGSTPTEPNTDGPSWFGSLT